MAKITEKNEAKLLVEGNDDQHVIWALCQKFKIQETFDVIDCGNYQKVINQLKTRLKFFPENLNTLGIVVDADFEIENRWKSLKTILSDFGCQFEDKAIRENGVILIADGLPRLGIWLMPDNKNEGILENFVTTLIPKDDKLWPESERILLEIETQKLNKYKNKDRQKALIATWLAWQENPGKPMGTAITAKVLSLDNDLCQRFKKWLKALFNPEQQLTTH